MTASVESSCPSGFHRCHNGRCIAAVFVCDDDNDCKDENSTGIAGISSDEADCVYTCPRGKKVYCHLLFPFTYISYDCCICYLLSS